MKKISIIFAVLAVFMVLVSCGGLSDYGTPTELVGTWNGSVVLAPGTYAGDGLKEKISFCQESMKINGSNKSNFDAEGTWEYKDTEYPTVPSVKKVNGVETTTYNYNDDGDNTDVLTTVETGKLVIAANGSYTLTKTTTKTYAEADAILSDNDATDYKKTNGRSAQLAGVQTDVVTTTVTVTVNADGTFAEKTIVKNARTYEGDRFNGLTGYTTENTSTNTNIEKKSSLSFVSKLSGSKYIHTVPVKNVYGYNKTYSLVINKDGSYTSTFTHVETKNTDAATKTIVTVETGFVIGKPQSEEASGRFTFNRTGKKETTSGTGEWEAAAKVEEDTTANVVSIDTTYYIAKNKLRTSAYEAILTLVD